MKIIKTMILVFFLVFYLGGSPDNFPIVVNKCNISQDVVAKFIIPDLINLRLLGFDLVNNDTIYDTGSIVFYIPNLNVYYVTKRNTKSVKYDGEIYKLVGYDCIDKE